MSVYDVVILGGGVAGCVLAARLSEDPGRTVCLVEAGPDYGPDVRAWPDALRDARALPRDDVWERHVPMHRVRAKVLGGSSCVNGCWHTWPSAADHREWTDLVGPQWSAAALEPFRQRAIAQMELIPPPATELSAFATAAVDAARALGFAEVDMAATGSTPGYGVPLLNAIDGVRWNAAFAYLSAARTRPNLTVLGDSPVRRLIVRDGRVRGVVVDGRAEPVTGGAYVLAAGALGSPAILLRSGVGPARHLKEVGVETEVDLPGVGANLSDQPGVFMPLAPTPELNATLAAQQAAGDLYVSRVLARAATAGAPAGGWDLHILPVAGPPLFGKLPPGQYEAGISAYLMKPASRGHVRLHSADPADPLDIDPAVLSDPDGLDLATMRAGLRLVERFADQPAVARWTRRTGPSPAELTDEELRRRASVYWHPVGTCAAGPDADPDAVVDGEGRVRGIANLRVADASILPTAPAANTQLPVLAIAEQLADTLRRTL
ncbi:GMC family oxidoreductase [Hamadaea tsunoensis]|uniref:GMC family oxidoreductase n=1 Tax=Hamadaea tsunoensis TaxID=53368 RepID=UPI00040A0023|nr:GMC family oxidoreductase [Hamadaea tsunoensis]